MHIHQPCAWRPHWHPPIDICPPIVGRIYPITIYKFNWHIFSNSPGPNLLHPNFPGAQFAGAQFARDPNCLEPLWGEARLTMQSIIRNQKWETKKHKSENSPTPFVLPLHQKWWTSWASQGKGILRKDLSPSPSQRLPCSSEAKLFPRTGSFSGCQCGLQSNWDGIGVMKNDCCCETFVCWRHTKYRNGDIDIMMAMVMAVMLSPVSK